MTMEKKHHGLVGDTEKHHLIHAFMAQNNSTLLLLGPVTPVTLPGTITSPGTFEWMMGYVR